MNTTWEYLKTVVENQPCIINELNIWDFTWENTGQNIRIIDPKYKEPHTLFIYEIKHAETTIQFAAGEFSNGVWGIYQPIKTS